MSAAMGRRRPGGPVLLGGSVLLGGALVGALSLAGGAAQAHPHAWIDVRVELQFDAAGAVASLRQTWLFDPYYTVFATEGMDADGDGRPDPDQLAELLAVHLGNLEEYGYFTAASAAGEAVAFGAPSGGVNAMRGDRLEMSFLLPLAAPADPAAGGFSYRVYDPTYYIEMLHAEEPPAVRLLDAPAGCDYRIEPANPAPEAVGLAAAADRSQRVVPGPGGATIGALFAETVTVDCP
ncbi:MAG: DUF1007 family protein [Tistlia sp.]|uniref:DUF1007 family protein n=1 Tax=Tistlia sp. TaxID=3057121 RepID=UPI0034A35776